MTAGRYLRAVCVVACACAATVAYAGVLIRPGREFRSTTAGSYEVSVKKNGTAEVSLSGDRPVFMKAYPAIWFEGKAAPEPLQVRGARSSRYAVNDQLGQGHGVTVSGDTCLWSQRIYPAEPYFTVQVAYTNTSKKPVQVKMLSPWFAGDGKRGGFTMGAGTLDAAFLDGGRQFPGDVTAPGLRSGPGVAMWNFGAYNRANGRSLIAGFLTYSRAYGQFRANSPITDKDGASRFGSFSAECIYDPPVTVEPGQQLVSEAVYFSVGERNPLEGLERYGHAVRRANGLRRPPAFLPHGWDSWSTEYRSEINEARVLENLDAMASHLSRYGWNHFAIDDGWQLALGDWEPDPERFPKGMKWIADRIHERGLTAGLWVAPFRVSTDSRLAKEHPEWLRGPNALGRQAVGDNDRILDITAPGAYDYVRNLASKIGNDWGFDALMEADYVYYLPLAESYHDSSKTRVEIHRMGMEALREGLGAEKVIMGFAPQPVTAMFAEGMRIGNDCAPIWRQAPGRWPWGCVETLRNAAKKYYMSGAVWWPDQDCVFFAHPATRDRWGVADLPALTRDQSIAWLTGAAMTGGVVKIGDRFSALEPGEFELLRKLLPVLDRPARPIDLFDSDSPQIWTVPVRSPIGEWTMLAAFNWSESTDQTFTVPFSQLGLAADGFYTVYGFWEDTYYGTAEKEIRVAVPPGAVRLLCLRRYTGKPMFIATNRHWSCGATDFTRLEWDEGRRTLRGAFNGISNTDYRLRVLVPEPFQLAGVRANSPSVDSKLEGNMLTIHLRCETNSEVQWEAKF